ncbi:hypothetical protein BCR32DRAFT_280857 [Anaeromyces robustus]|uniref:Uncharacterized protein n=1 Tax=Anaeromyces robustus TaxID=1754192 RepID=A0A1Y1X368_9FUNG|nr:hypothetical protein BCR32DRAFT_280857 [Anaeromyces robustus]|eukprot:ORX80078.1 hypothetical protein BCR32DRAFT_280857 [Anaeromyces robustus]
MTNTYSDVVYTLTLTVDASRFLSPILSWLLVTYVYIAIGVRSKNSLWRHLYIACANGVIATLLYVVGVVSKNLDTELYENKFKYLEYPEHFFFALNEWGLIYINFVKIRSCIETLKSKFWRILINLLFIYSIFFHMLIAYYEIEEVNGGDKKSEKVHAILYAPVGVLEIYFMLLIIVSVINEENDESKDVLSILLYSSLTRMFIVSFILLGISGIVFVDVKHRYGLLIKRLLWRLKGALGIVYLVDFLLIRVDLNANIIRKNEVEILKYCVKEKNYEVKNEEKGESDTFGLDLEDPYGLNKTPIDDYIQTSSTLSKMHSNYSTFNNSPISDYNNNGNLFGNNLISDNNSGKLFGNNLISDNNNGIVFGNNPTSDYNNNNNNNNNGNMVKNNYYNNNENIFEYNRDSLFIPKETNTPMVSNIVTTYNDMYSPGYSNKSNRNSYKTMSNNYNIRNNKNNGDIKLSPTFIYTKPEI